MDRRTFLKAGGALSLTAAFPRLARTQGFDPGPAAGWRDFEVITRVEILKPEGTTRAWIPIPSVNEPDWFRSGTSKWTTNATNAKPHIDAKYRAGMVTAEWAPAEKSPTIEVVSRITARDRAVDWSKPRSVTLSAEERELYTSPTELLPTDGIVRQTALAATRGANTEIEKARAIYEWIVDNTFRDPKTRGCGLGNIKAMLELGNLGGKCADLNALYVGLARAVGLPARDVYGIRVAKSRFGYKSLGAASENITKAQHCRAEVFLSAYGWVPVDPADVRKVVLEEPPGKLAMTDPKVTQVREKLFGAWETNWLAYNFAHDVTLPGSRGPKLGFLMYPNAETAAGRLDSLDPNHFRYVITAREITA